MVELQPSKLVTGVRFPSPAQPGAHGSAILSPAGRALVSGPRVPVPMNSTEMLRHHHVAGGDATGARLDRAKRVESSMTLVRWFGFVLGVYLIANSGTAPIPASAGTIRLGEAVMAALGLGNLAITFALRRARSMGDLRRIALAGFGVDAFVLIALVWTFSYSPLDTTWVILYVLPLEATLRYQMGGAVVASAAILANEVVREAYLGGRFATYAFSVQAVTFRVGIGVIIALVSGLMARSLEREATRANEQAENAVAAAAREAAARREAAAFNSIILAGLRE